MGWSFGVDGMRCHSKERNDQIEIEGGDLQFKRAGEGLEAAGGMR